MTHFSLQRESDWTYWMMDSEKRSAGRRMERAVDESSGQSDPLQSSASPGSGFLESDPKWGSVSMNHLKNQYRA